MSKVMKSSFRTWVLMFLIMSLFVPPLTFAADPTADGDRVDAVKTAQERLQTRITYACTDKPIDDVLMDLADVAGIAIVKSPKVTGNVTARVTNKPLAEAMTNILAAHDFTYVATEHMIRVVPISEVTLAKEELVSKIYRITYADANEVATALAGFVSDKGRVGLNKGTSHIVVTDTEYKIKAVDKFVEELDRETPLVEIEVRIYDITTKEGFELDKNWHLGRNAPLRTIDRTKTNIDSDSPSTLTTTTQTTERRDESGGSSEYKIGSYPESRFPSGSMTTSTTNTGMRDDAGLTTTVTELPKTTYTDTKTESYVTRRRKPFVGSSFDRVGGGSLSFSLLNDAVDLELALNVLKTQVESKLLANPRVLVVDNETANFEIARELPYTELSQTGRDLPIRSTRYRKVGVSLQVTPRVTRDAMLRVHITPEFSILVSQDELGVPTIDTRKADTIALVKDGQTVAIGGLRKKQTSKNIAKVPVLGDMPLLGGLFQSETESEEINELIVFITPRIYTKSDLAEAEMPAEMEREFPKEPPAVVGRAKKDHEKAIGAYTDSLDVDSNDPEIMLPLAFAYIKAGRFEQAKELLDSIIGMQPDSGTAHQYLGYCHLKLQDTDSAIESYMTAVELDDGDWEAHRGLGVAYMLKARRTKDDSLKARAIEQWQRSLDINPDQPTRDGLLKLIEIYSK
jgi:type II secretory pathway component GspD/PulD (secretin)